MIGELAYLDQQSAFNWDACNDPIKDLLLHSDCDGELSVEQMKVIMPRLKEMVAPWPEGDLDREKAFELVGGMELAISNNEPLAFS